MINNLKIIRLTKGLSQTALAREAKTSRQNIYEIEHGKRDPGTKLSLRLARALECSVEDIFLNDLSNMSYKPFN